MTGLRHVWCSLCHEPHEPCEDELACLDMTDEEWDRLDGFYEAEDERDAIERGDAG